MKKIIFISIQSIILFFLTLQTSFADFPTTNNNGIQFCIGEQIQCSSNPNFIGQLTSGSFNRCGMTFNRRNSTGSSFTNLGMGFTCNVGAPNSGCPVNSTKNSTSASCSCNQGFTQQGSLCVANSPPLPNNCQSGQIKILPFIAQTGCTVVGDGQPQCSIQTPSPSFECFEGCTYENLPNFAINSCYTRPSENNSTYYCERSFSNNGNSCNTVSLVPSTGSNNTPQSTTPVNTSEQNSNTSNGSNSGNPNSTGGTGTKGAQGTGSTPSSGSNPQSPSPGESPQGNQNGSLDCPDCATEATAQNIADALRNVDGSTDSPDLTDIGVQSADISDLMVDDDRIKNIFTFKIPAHNRTCPTALIPLDFFNRPAITFDTHCQLIAPNYEYIRSIALIAWLLMSMLKILES